MAPITPSPICEGHHRANHWCTWGRSILALARAFAIPWEALVIGNVSITCSWRGASLYLRLQHRILREIAWVWSPGCTSRRPGMQLGRAQVFEYEMHAHSSMATSRVQVRAAWARRRTHCGSVDILPSFVRAVADTLTIAITCLRSLSWGPSALRI